jgi:hypothetical protein
MYLMLSFTSVVLHRTPRLEARSGMSFDRSDPAPGSDAIKALQHYVPASDSVSSYLLACNVCLFRYKSLRDIILFGSHFG